eukprot:10349975-Alexandrium_andersonii.AAC.1
MSASLVGSEMCIRDSSWTLTVLGAYALGDRRAEGFACVGCAQSSTGPPPVSYTHLTLPTICSV